MLTDDLTPNTILKATQTDEDDNASPEGIVTVVNKDLKGSVVISSSTGNGGVLGAVATLTNVLNGSNAKLYINGTLAATVAVVNTSGVKTATFTDVDVNNATSVKITVKATDLTGKEITSAVKTQSITT